MRGLGIQAFQISSALPSGSKSFGSPDRSKSVEPENSESASLVTTGKISTRLRVKVDALVQGNE